jgi:hypothetical protein
VSADVRWLCGVVVRAGLDADLIMLGVVSHEPHFALLREEVVFGSNRSQNLPRKAMTKHDEFQFLHLSLLREYIDIEFRQAFSAIDFYSLERVLDDWVFMCFLVGTYPPATTPTANAARCPPSVSQSASPASRCPASPLAMCR